MAAPPGGPFDLICSAGAVFNPGLGPALVARRGHLRGHLARGGRVAFSDPGRVRTGRPRWRRPGYRCWRHVAATEPLERALAACPEADLAQGFRAEIALWRRFGGSFGDRRIVCAPT